MKIICKKKLKKQKQSNNQWVRKSKEKLKWLKTKLRWKQKKKENMCWRLFFLSKAFIQVNIFSTFNFPPFFLQSIYLLYQFFFCCCLCPFLCVTFTLLWPNWEMCWVWLAESGSFSIFLPLRGRGAPAGHMENMIFVH